MGGREISRQETVCACDAGTPCSVLKIDLDVEKHEDLKKEEINAWEKYSIYKLPEGFVWDKERRFHAYKPQVVSLGPYHHGEEQVLAMEEHKLRALRQFLARTKKGVGEYREALKQGEGLQRLMDSYKDLDKDWREDKERFLKIMILDGCFMLEVMRIIERSTFDEYDEHDPIFSYNGLISNLPRIKRDMLMLENQIPLLVLHKLLAVENNMQKQCDLNQKVNKMVLDFFSCGSKQTSAADTYPSTAATTSTGLHVLDVVRKSMIKDGRETRSDEQTDSHNVIWPATHLEEAGIQFRKSDSTSLKDIIFQKGYLNATLSLPQLLVDDSTESKFLNLIAFEHLHTGSGKEVSSYVSFMDNIIDSEKDVSLLCKNDIIKNFVGTGQAVADLFNGISHDVSIDPRSYLGKVHRDVIAYCNDPCKKSCANLKHRYFSTPCSVIAFIAATIALVICVLLRNDYLHND